MCIRERGGGGGDGDGDDDDDNGDDDDALTHTHSHCSLILRSCSRAHTHRVTQQLGSPARTQIHTHECTNEHTGALTRSRGSVRRRNKRKAQGSCCCWSWTTAAAVKSHGHFFFSSLGKRLLALSLSHADYLSRTLHNSLLTLSLSLSVFIARTHRSATQSLPAAPLTDHRRRIGTAAACLLLLLQNYYYTKYYYTHPSLGPSTASPHERGSLTRGSLSAAANDVGRRRTTTTTINEKIKIMQTRSVVARIAHRRVGGGAPRTNTASRNRSRDAPDNYSEQTNVPTSQTGVRDVRCVGHRRRRRRRCPLGRRLELFFFVFVLAISRFFFPISVAGSDPAVRTLPRPLYQDCTRFFFPSTFT